ncbi:MAG: cation diffusion facilitator family transporter [Chloroflexota bacterium]
MTEHQHSNEISHFREGSRSLKIALAIIVVIMIAEVIGGILSNSLSLLGDAGHMMVDALALGLSLFAMTLARRPVTATRTYGYHRAEIIAALINGTTLVVVSLYIFYEAYQRFQDPPEVRTPLMLTVAAIGLAANLAGVFLLRESHGSLNIKAAFWHIVGDTISSVGVILAGVIIALTGWYVADPIMAVFIGIIILWGAVRIVRESADILLEAVPRHLQTEEVIGAIKEITGVDDVHDVHIWTITSGLHALSAHLLVKEQMVSDSSTIVEKVNRYLAQNFNIRHTTLQVECQTCTAECVCNLPPIPEAQAHEVEGEALDPQSKIN